MSKIRRRYRQRVSPFLLILASNINNASRKRFSRLISYLPLGWLVIFNIFVLRAYLKLGYLPGYDHPDPKALGMPVNYSLVFWGLFLVIISVIPWLIALIITCIVDRRKVVIADAVIYLILYVTIIGILRSEALGFGDWLMD